MSEKGKNKLIVNTNSVREELSVLDNDTILGDVNDIFQSIDNFNTNWQDSKNSKIFCKAIEEYKSRVTSLMEKIKTLKTNVLSDMDVYDQIEKSSASWE